MIIISDKSGTLKPAFAETPEAYLAYSGPLGPCGVAIHAYDKAHWSKVQVEPSVPQLSEKLYSRLTN